MYQTICRYIIHPVRQQNHISCTSVRTTNYTDTLLITCCIAESLPHSLEMWPPLFKFYQIHHSRTPSYFSRATIEDKRRTTGMTANDANAMAATAIVHRLSLGDHHVHLLPPSPSEQPPQPTLLSCWPTQQSRLP